MRFRKQGFVLLSIMVLLFSFLSGRSVRAWEHAKYHVKLDDTGWKHIDAGERYPALLVALVRKAPEPVTAFLFRFAVPDHRGLYGARIKNFINGFARGFAAQAGGSRGDVRFSGERRFSYEGLPAYDAEWSMKARDNTILGFLRTIDAYEATYVLIIVGKKVAPQSPEARLLASFHFTRKPRPPLTRSQARAKRMKRLGMAVGRLLVFLVLGGLVTAYFIRRRRKR